MAAPRGRLESVNRSDLLAVCHGKRAEADRYVPHRFRRPSFPVSVGFSGIFAPPLSRLREVGPLDTGVRKNRVRYTAKWLSR